MRIGLSVVEHGSSVLASILQEEWLLLTLLCVGEVQMNQALLLAFLGLQEKSVTRSSNLQT